MRAQIKTLRIKKKLFPKTKNQNTRINWLTKISHTKGKLSKLFEKGIRHNDMVSAQIDLFDKVRNINEHEKIELKFFKSLLLCHHLERVVNRKVHLNRCMAATDPPRVLEEYG